MRGSILDRTPASISLWGAQLPPPQDDIPKQYDVLWKSLEESIVHYAEEAKKDRCNNMQRNRQLRLSALAEILLDEIPGKGTIDDDEVHLALRRTEIQKKLRGFGYNPSIATIESDLSGIGYRVHVKFYTPESAHYDPEMSTKVLRRREEKEMRKTMRSNG